jgi:hypothetical protein
MQLVHDVHGHSDGPSTCPGRLMCLGNSDELYLAIMTPRKQAFVDHYITSLNASSAAKYNHENYASWAPMMNKTRSES